MIKEYINIRKERKENGTKEERNPFEGACAQLERDNISFRLQSGRKRYIEKGGKLGRKVGSVKTTTQMKAEYREVISLLRKGYSIRDVAKLSSKGVSTVQRVKRLLKVQSLQ